MCRIHGQYMCSAPRLMQRLPVREVPIAVPVPFACSLSSPRVSRASHSCIRACALTVYSGARKLRAPDNTCLILLVTRAVETCGTSHECLATCSCLTANYCIRPCSSLCTIELSRGDVLHSHGGQRMRLPVGVDIVVCPCSDHCNLQPTDQQGRADCQGTG